MSMKRIKLSTTVTSFLTVTSLLIHLPGPAALAESPTCAALFSNSPIKLSDQPAKRRNVLASTVKGWETMSDEERLEKETELAKKALRGKYLEKKKFLDQVRATLKEDFTDYDDFIDEIMRVPERVHLVLPGQPVDRKPALIVHLHGPAGVGKTTVLTRFYELLGSADRLKVVKIKRDQVEFPNEELQALADQRFREPGVAGLIVDEAFYFKLQKDLKSDKQVPLENDKLGTESGAPRMRVDDEVTRREDSLAVFHGAAGSGEGVRIAKNSPSNYLNHLFDLREKFNVAREAIVNSKARIANASQEPTVQVSTEQTLINSNESNLRIYDREMYQLFKTMKADQPDFFSPEGVEEALKEKPDLGIPADLADYSASRLSLLWKTKPAAVEDFLAIRASKMPDNPLESYHNVIIAFTGNPIKSIEKVERSFRGRKATAQEVFDAYVRLVNDKEVEEELLARFPNDPAMRSRLRSGTVKMRRPLNQAGYDKLIARAIAKFERGYVNNLGAMGVTGTKLTIDQSVTDLLKDEAISALQGTREFFPRLDTIIESANYRVIGEIAMIGEAVQEAKEEGLQPAVAVPSEVHISFDPKTRHLMIRSSGQPDLLQTDFLIPEFREEILMSPVLDTHTREKRSIFLASVAVVGMAFHHSFPKELNLHMRQMTLNEFWVPSASDTHRTQQGQIATLFAGMVGEQKYAAGSFISDWSKDGRDLVETEVVKHMIEDLEYRTKDVPYLIRMVREADPKGRLPRGLVDHLLKSELRGVPEILLVTIRAVDKILTNNKDLVKAIAVDLEKKEIVNKDDLQKILDQYTLNTKSGKKFNESIRRTLFKGPDQLVQSDRIFEPEAGAVHVPHAEFFADPEQNKGMWKKLRKSLFGLDDSFWK